MHFLPWLSFHPRMIDTVKKEQGEIFDESGLILAAFCARQIGLFSWTIIDLFV